MLGIYVRHLAKEKGIPNNELKNALDCSDVQLRSSFSGRALASFKQISCLADILGVTVKQLLAGDEDLYNSTVNQYTGNFSNPENREIIFDIIDNYLDVFELSEI
ncbi:MAG: hypothetical protein UH542_06040 [Bacteroidales bacterium]|nr:hypothetical protein [Bacteroidales bacterium]